MAVAEERRQRLAAFLAANEFCDLFSLKNAGHPRKWAGAGDFASAELEALHRWCRSVCIFMP